MAQLIVNVYAFQRQPTPAQRAERNEIIFV